MKRFFKWLGIILVALIIILALVVKFYVAPSTHALREIASGYAAKTMCSSVFISKRSADEVWETDVVIGGANPVFGAIWTKVDTEGGLVDANMYLLGDVPRRAVYREGLGCTVLPSGQTASDHLTDIADELPEVAAAPLPVAPDATVQQIIDRSFTTDQGTRAAVVLKDGAVIAEAYADGFTAETPLIGWSMAKTVTAMMAGQRIGDGALTLEDSPQWLTGDVNDVSLAAMMGMADGLEFAEDYGTVNDVTRMLFVEEAMGRFAADKPAEHAPETNFSYSSGTTNIVAEMVKGTYADKTDALTHLHRRLYAPLGLTQAQIETDNINTYVGSSYMFATAREWAKLGQLLINDGMWDGEQVLPAGWAGYMMKPHPASDGFYTKGFMWLQGPGGGDAGFDLPADTRWMLGHDGQSVALIPSQNLVIVRLGLSPDPHKQQKNVVAVLEALK